MFAKKRQTRKLCCRLCFAFWRGKTLVKKKNADALNNVLLLHQDFLLPVFYCLREKAVNDNDNHHKKDRTIDERHTVSLAEFDGNKTQTILETKMQSLEHPPDVMNFASVHRQTIRILFRFTYVRWRVDWKQKNKCAQRSEQQHHHQNTRKPRKSSSRSRSVLKNAGDDKINSEFKRIS